MLEDNVIDTNKINEAQEAFDQADSNLEVTILKHHFTFNFQEINPSNTKYKSKVRILGKLFKSAERSAG